MIATARSLFGTFIGEPLDLIRAQPHQLFISTASIALMGSFAGASGILDPTVAYLLAIGIEWAYFRGLASDSRAPTMWGAILNWSACAVVMLWGMLWVGRFTGALVEGGGGWLLAAAHVIPIAWLSLCSAQTHRAAMVLEVQQRAAAEARLQLQAEAEAEAERRQREIEAADARELRRQREQQQLALEERYRLMKIEEEQRSMRAARRTNTAPHSAAGTPTNTTREHLREQIARTLSEHPDANRAALARQLGIGRTLLYEIIQEARQAGQLPSEERI